MVSLVAVVSLDEEMRENSGETRRTRERIQGEARKTRGRRLEN